MSSVSAVVAQDRAEVARPSRAELRRRQEAERTSIGRLNKLGRLLQEIAPEAFGSPIPLAVGIKNGIVELLEGEFTADEVDRFLRYYTRSEQYLRALALGQMRVYLDGRIASTPTAAQRRLAGKQLRLKATARAPRKGTAAT